MSHSGGKTFITVTVFPVSLLACLQTHNQPCFWLIDEVGGGWPHLSSHCCAFCTLQRQRCTGTFGFGNVEYMTRTITHGLGWQLKSKMVWRKTTMVCWWCCGGIICEVWATLDNLLEYVLVFSGIWALASCFPYKYQFLLFSLAKIKEWSFHEKVTGPVRPHRAPRLFHLLPCQSVHGGCSDWTISISMR